MKRLPIEYRPQAVDDIEQIFRYVLETSFDVVTAVRFTDRLFGRCEKIGDAPFGGVSREDLGPGIRIVPFERKAVILYAVRDQAVWITNIFSGWRDYEALLRQTPTDE